MTPNGKRDPVASLFSEAAHDVGDASNGDDYDALIELDRLEELLESLDDLGVSNRAEVEALPATEMSVQVLAELDALNLLSRGDIEQRLAEIEASLDDE